ncbi:MAG: pantetheine-phosphate adenylyltransferase [Actinomycetaceae bacterium]|nr:pantetheine-phosphate adenylyltransferase [Actinomycetaceae bacterium]
MSIAVCPGSFDPITIGHVDMVRRVAAIFDEVVVVIANNPAKNYMFSEEKRREMAEVALMGIDGVRVEVLGGILLASFCHDIRADVIVKGLRGTSDFEAEQSMALMNSALGDIDTFFIAANPSLVHVSSTLVKEVASYGGSIRGMVPVNVEAALKGALSNNRLGF